MKALVTGATGFIGGNLVRELLKDGHEVRALCRPEADRSTLKDLDVEVAIGDLRDRGSLTGAMKGREALFHTAALYSLWSPDPGDFVKTNVDGTVNILEAAMEAEVSQGCVYEHGLGVRALEGWAHPQRKLFLITGRDCGRISPLQVHS